MTREGTCKSAATDPEQNAQEASTLVSLRGLFAVSDLRCLSVVQKVVREMDIPFVTYNAK